MNNPDSFLFKIGHDFILHGIIIVYGGVSYISWVWGAMVLLVVRAKGATSGGS